jgi:hypothetical protein
LLIEERELGNDKSIVFERKITELNLYKNQVAWTQAKDVKLKFVLDENAEQSAIYAIDEIFVE